MAFPNTITTDGLAYKGCAGPYLSSAGNVYVIVPDDQLFDLRALKGVDPATAFSAVGTDVVIGAGTDTIKCVTGFQVGKIVHVLTKNGHFSDPIDIRYHQFNMSSDAWAVSNEMVKANFGTAAGGSGQDHGIGIAVRNDGHVIAIYNGIPETIATVDYDRVYYARRIGSTWSTDIALSPLGVTASWVGGVAIHGANDRTHFFMQDVTNADLYQRTLTSAYSLEPLPSAFDLSTGDTRAQEQGGVYNTAMNIVSMPWYSAFQTLDNALFSSVDAPTLSLSANITNPQAVLTDPVLGAAAQAVDGNVIWNVFINTSNDLYTQSNVNGGGWSAPTLQQTASASCVYANIFVRGASKVLAFVFHDTDPKYSEITLSTSGVASMGIPNGFLLTGVGR